MESNIIETQRIETAMYSRKVYFAGQYIVVTKHEKGHNRKCRRNIMHVRDNFLFSEKYSAPKNK